MRNITQGSLLRLRSHKDQLMVVHSLEGEDSAKIYIRWLDAYKNGTFKAWRYLSYLCPGHDDFDIVSEEEEILLCLAYPQLAEALKEARIL